MKPDEIKSHPAFSQPWYYVIELGPGLYTPGKERPNVGLTRRLLHKIEIESGARCLDIGAQEGLVSILLGRRGGEVVAYDRIYPEERIRLVREALGADFELLGEPITGRNERRWLGHGGPMPNVGMSLPELRAELAGQGYKPFDVVVFSGVLYHVYDPLASLALVRGLVRTGGIVVVETAAMFDGGMTLNLNAAGRFNEYTIWLPSLGCLDYLLRIVRLEPLEVAYFGRARGRIAVACRAVEAARAKPGDEYLRSRLHDYELAEYLDWSAVASAEPAVGYDGVGRRGTTLFNAVRDGTPYRPSAEEKRLDIDAKL